METIGQSIRTGASLLHASTTPMLDARILMRAATGMDDADLILNEKTVLADDAGALFQAYIDRRAKREPIGHILGAKDFMGRTFELAPGVLIPRPDTETLVEAVLNAVGHDAHEPLRICDLGVGSGCILVSLLERLPNATGVGVDINGSAIKVARRNAGSAGVGARASFFVGDWCAALNADFNVIVANPPYVASNDAVDGDCSFEDDRALYAGVDGMDAYRRICADIGKITDKCSLVAFEVGAEQAEHVEGMVRLARPLAETKIFCDLAGRERVVLSWDASQQKNVEM
ncbi:MAG: peptide chain release factor N(5)-glutamine methyltransferase [Pseudomonadota bacterium]